MEAEALKLTIVTPERIFFKDEVSKIVFSTTEGEIEIQLDHEPLTALIASSVFRIFDEEDNKIERIAAVHGGYVEVLPTQITVITSAAEWPHELDLDRAKAALERAEKELEKSKSEEEVAVAKASLLRALTRVQVHATHKTK